MNGLTDKINWEKVNGLVPCVVQDKLTNRVLMLAYMNKDALTKTLATGKIWFFSRTKKRLWMKGEKSKNCLYLSDILVDCDGDTLLVKAVPAGPACHKNTESCFGQLDFDVGILAELYRVIAQRRVERPRGSYTSELFNNGQEKICAKIIEESEEVCRAAKQETKQRLIEESVDVLYHLLVLLASKQVDLAEVWQEIGRRRSNSKLQSQ